MHNLSGTLAGIASFYQVTKYDTAKMSSNVVRGRLVEMGYSKAECPLVGGGTCVRRLTGPIKRRFQAERRHPQHQGGGTGVILRDDVRLGYRCVTRSIHLFWCWWCWYFPFSSVAFAMAGTKARLPQENEIIFMAVPVQIMLGYCFQCIFDRPW